VHFGEVDCHVLFFSSGFNVLHSIHTIWRINGGG
jgi:hypothetical protein